MPTPKPLKSHQTVLVAALFAMAAVSASAQTAPEPGPETFAPPFNIAEAVTDPFLDYFTSTFDQWRVTEDPERRLKVWQDWDIVIFEWGSAPVDGPALRVERDVNLDCSRCNRLVLHLCAPKQSDVVLTAETDAGARSARLEESDGTKALIRLDLDGAKRITQLRIEIFAGAEGQATGYLIWMVMQNTDLLKEYFRQWDFEHMDWSRYLMDRSFEPTFVPTYGIFATEDEIAAMREEHERQVAETGESQFTRVAERYRNIEPERWIHRYLFKHDEVERTGVEGFDDAENLQTCEQLPLAAVVLKDKELLRLTARHALSTAMCQLWCKDFSSNIPGGYREDRSFRRSSICRTIARDMDFAGELFTETGLLYLLRRLTEEGVGKLDYVFWRFDYIHSCNQGPCFSAGRIPAHLVLERHWPRVEPYTELAFKDVLGFYDNALLPDGGYLEGPSYLNMTLHYALLTTDLYARGRGLKLEDIAPPVLQKTADYITCVSSTLPDRDVIPVEDCGGRMGRSEMLAMSSLVPGSYWVTMCRKAIARDGFQPEEPNEYTLLRNLPESGPDHPAFVRLPETRMVASLRHLDGEPVKWLIIGNKGDAPHSHEHEDRGSFVLEFARERFAADLGAESYNDANHILAKQCQLHNMLVPTGVEGRPQPTKPVLADVDPVGDGDDASLHIEMDATPGWDTFYKRWRRTWDSPDPATMVITDEYEVAQGDGAAFYWQTYLPCSIDGRTVTIEGKRGIVTLEAPEGTEVSVDVMPTIYGMANNRIAIAKKGVKGTIEVKVRLAVQK